MSAGPDVDVLVVGAGPAGLAAAHACVGCGLSVVVADPRGAEPWRPTYATWLDDLPAGFAATLSTTWDDVRAVGRSQRRLGRPYGVFDNARLAELLRGRPYEVVAAGVEAVTATRGGLKIDFTSGGVRARCVIDARGPAATTPWRSSHIDSVADGHVNPAAVSSDDPETAAATATHDAGTRNTDAASTGPAAASGEVARQRAVGYIARFDTAPIAPGSCVLMDWTPPDRRYAAGGAGAATFLYGFDRGDGTFLVEETSLARNRPMEFDELQARLDSRLVRLGCTVERLDHVEFVDIPMRTGIPRAGVAVAFGSGGGQLHPFTGYSVAASLRTAPLLARSAATGISDGLSGRRLAAAVTDAIWPASLRRARALQDYGLAAALQLNPDQAMDFFEAFFAMPLTMWRPALDVRATPRQMRSMMLRMFATAPGGIRRRLVSGDPRLLARSVAPGNRLLRWS